jgi:hypothetical protein
MNVLFVATGAFVLTVTMAGCGDPSRPHLDPDLAGKPTWGECQERSIQAIDYVADAPGATSRAAALAPYREEGDHVVDHPAGPHRNAQVLLVDAGNVIHHALELSHTENGWLVGMVDTCAD